MSHTDYDIFMGTLMAMHFGSRNFKIFPPSGNSYLNTNIAQGDADANMVTTSANVNGVFIAGGSVTPYLNATKLADFGFITFDNIMFEAGQAVIYGAARDVLDTGGGNAFRLSKTGGSVLMCGPCTTPDKYHVSINYRIL